MDNAIVSASMFDRIADPMQAVTKLGEMLARSGMFGCDKIEQGQVLALACLCERKTPFEIMRQFHIIEGKLSMRADAMLGEFRKRGGKYDWKRTDNEAAIILLTFDTFKAFEVVFTIDDAHRAGLCGPKGVRRPGQQRDGNWQQRPDAMLRARVVSVGLRMICPEIVAGVYTPEELFDTAEQNRDSNRATLEAKTELKPAKPAEQPALAHPVVKMVVSETEGEVIAVAGTPADAPAPAAAKPAQPAQGGVRKPTDDQKAVNEVLREAGLLNEGTAWMRKYGWIDETHNILDLAEDKCKRILTRPDSFIRAVKTGKAPKDAPVQA